MVKALLAGIGVSFLLAVLACCGGAPTATRTNPATTDEALSGEESADTAAEIAATKPPARPIRTVDRSIKITMDEYRRLEPGITYNEAHAIVGYHGEELSRTRFGDVETVLFAWENLDGTYAHLTFQGGRLVSRSQYGLPSGPSPLNLEKALQEIEEGAAREQARREMEQRAAEEAERQRMAMLELDKTAAPELAELLADPGDLSTTAQLDPFLERLKAFSSKYDGTASAAKAVAESTALAKLRLAYVWEQTPGRDATYRLREIVEEHPGSIAARAAEARLASR